MLVEADEEEEKISVFPATSMVFPVLISAAKWRVYATPAAALHNFEPTHVTGFHVHNGIQTKS